MYKIYYSGFEDYSGARIIYRPLRKVREFPLIAFATTITENNRDKASGNHTYICKKDR